MKSETDRSFGFFFVSFGGFLVWRLTETAFGPQVIERFPETCYRALSLCTLPLQPRQASALTNSSIVALLDKLCTSEWPHVANTAWINVHGLAMRTAVWRLRRIHGAETRGAIETLSAQLGGLLRGHLETVTNEEAASSATAQAMTVAPDPATEHIPPKLQILHILDNLAGSKLGQEIVSHPSCVMALLQILVRAGPSIVCPSLSCLLRSLGAPVCFAPRCDPSSIALFRVCGAAVGGSLVRWARE